MGIPAFYAWLAQKYSRISKKSKPAHFANVYLDVNGLIHTAVKGPHGGYLSDEKLMVAKVVEYIEFLVNMLEPSALVYLAIDGVAPRAKLNQQRARRFQSARDRALLEAADIEMQGMFEDDEDEGDIEAQKAHDELQEVKTNLNLGIYDQADAADLLHGPSAGASEKEPAVALFAETEKMGDPAANPVDPGADGVGLFSPSDDESPADDTESKEVPIAWDSNAITPGTPFMEKVADALRSWANALAEKTGLTIIVSDSNMPGEGEHKFMDFIRLEKLASTESTTRSEQMAHELLGHSTKRTGKWFGPNDSHAIVSLDADIILLSLSLHLPNIYIVREDRRSAPMERFEYCSINTLRDYFSEELVGKTLKYHIVYHRQTDTAVALIRKVVPEYHKPPPPDFERMLTDFILMMAFAGNDFLPHLPAAYVGQLTADFMLDLYCRLLAKDWSRARGYRYIVSADGSLNAETFKAFLEMYASGEESLFRQEAFYNHILTEQEIEEAGSLRSTVDDKWRLLYYGSISKISKNPIVEGKEEDEQGIPILTVDEMRELSDSYTRAWLEGVTWVLHYYNNPGTLSWQWFYPHYHAPFALDVLNFLEARPASTLSDIEASLAGTPGHPLQPKQQLLSVLPPASFHLLPTGYAANYREHSKNLYPDHWALDLTGCRADYHGVPVLPFLDITGLQRETDAVTPVENTKGDKIYCGKLSARAGNTACFGRFDVQAETGDMTEAELPGGGLKDRRSSFAVLTAWHPLSSHPDVCALDIPQYCPWRPEARQRLPWDRVAKAILVCAILVRVFRKKKAVLYLCFGVVCVALYASTRPKAIRGSTSSRKYRVHKSTTAMEFWKPKRSRIDWICTRCLSKNWERQVVCFRCKVPKQATDLLFYLPMSNRWSSSCYTANHLPQVSEQ
ncbi:5prime-3prime exoribonuclease 4 [Diplonema papillatum]|nr:5prime-3prime exoribonuclease 4 [Diplonema papillatum]